MLTTSLRKARTPSDREVRCHRCGEPIERDSPAIAASFATLGSDAARRSRAEPDAWFHATCAVDVHLGKAFAVLFDPSDSAPYQDARRIAFERFSDLAVIDPARDHKGRPRVTVRILGDVAVERSDPWRRIAALCRDFALVSTRFEYVLDPLRNEHETRLLSDPSRPIVGAVLAMTIGSVTTAHRAKLQAMFVHGFSTPTLWVIGAADDARRDAKVVELRAALDAIGFDGDDAIALCSDAVDEASLASLSRCLDEQTLRALETSPAQRFEALVDALERALSDRDEPAIATRAGSLSKSLKRNPIVARSGEKTIEVDASVQSRARVAAVGALLYASARDPALDVLWHFRDPKDAGALEALLDAMWAESSRSLSTAFNKAHGLLRELSTERAANALIRGFFHDHVGKSRRRDLGALLLGAKLPTLADALRERAAARPKRDAVAREAEALATELERTLATDTARRR
ncbi:MAG: hypothetical protein JNK05_14575 [Myxococcales bacterium]|nr:hypothetical protein [Myxococcales bacterium]